MVVVHVMVRVVLLLDVDNFYLGRRAHGFATSFAANAQAFVASVACCLGQVPLFTAVAVAVPVAQLVLITAALARYIIVVWDRTRGHGKVRIDEGGEAGQRGVLVISPGADDRKGVLGSSTQLARDLPHLICNDSCEGQEACQFGSTRTTHDARRSMFDARRSTLDARRSTLDARRSTLDALRSTLDDFTYLAKYPLGSTSSPLLRPQSCVRL
jgi:hypothetical protein